MRRYKLILGGTAAGIVGVLAFPTHHGTHLAIPPAGASAVASAGSTTATTAGPSPTSSPASSSPASSSPASSAESAGSAASPVTKTATSGDQSFPYGDLAVKVTVTGSKVTGVSITTLDESDSRSASIDRYAIPQLEQRVVAAGSVHIDGVSGATFTSQAFVDAVANALQKLGIAT